MQMEQYTDTEIENLDTKLNDFLEKEKTMFIS